MTLEQVPATPPAALDERPRDHLARFHERIRSREPDLVYELSWSAATLVARGAFRARGIGAGNVPRLGPAIIAANHASFLDPFIVGAFVGRQVQFMAKSRLYRGPLQFIYLHGGVFPVVQGERDEDAFATAHAVLGRGGCVVIFPEGGRSTDGGPAESARPGVGRLALESGAPVIPAAILDSHRVRRWTRLRFTKVTVEYGAPLRWDPIPDATRAEHQRATDEIFGTVRQLHAGLAERGHAGARRAGRAIGARWPRRRP